MPVRGNEGTQCFFTITFIQWFFLLIFHTKDVRIELKEKFLAYIVKFASLIFKNQWFFMFPCFICYIVQRKSVNILNFILFSCPLWKKPYQLYNCFSIVNNQLKKSIPAMGWVSVGGFPKGHAEYRRKTQFLCYLAQKTYHQTRGQVKHSEVVCEVLIQAFHYSELIILGRRGRWKWRLHRKYENTRRRVGVKKWGLSGDQLTVLG